MHSFFKWNNYVHANNIMQIGQSLQCEESTKYFIKFPLKHHNNIIHYFSKWKLSVNIHKT